MTRPSIVIGTLLLAGAATTICPAETAAAESPRAPLNVLFLVVDDLRPELGCYGADHIRSPHIDRLAGQGMLFQRAYCQVAVCNASRSSVLSGCRPDTTGVLTNQVFLRPQMPDVITLPQHFKNHGYQSVSLGKIFHHSQREPGDDPQSWSEPSWYGESSRTWFTPQSLEMIAGLKAAAKKGETRIVRGPPYEAADEPDDSYSDGQLAAKAVETLQRIKDRPFFLGVGFHKPHLAFCCPQKYWDLYPAASIKLPDNYWPPKGAPQPALHNWYELRTYGGIPQQGPIDEQTARNLIRGYRACVSFVDAQVGRVLDELERLDLARNTIVVLWGDHGYHLGENGIFTKMTNFELGTHAPLILRVPGRASGQRTAALVEFVDIYPTLAELCGLPRSEHLEGTSCLPLLVDPQRPWKKAVFSQYLRIGGHLAGLDALWGTAPPAESSGKRTKLPNVLGRSVRSDRWRYTEWKTEDGTPAGVELYDHEQDPAENVNLAADPAHADTVAEMAAMLAAGWRSALPPGVVSASPPREGAVGSPRPRAGDGTMGEGQGVRAARDERAAIESHSAARPHPSPLPEGEGTEHVLADFEGPTWGDWTATGEAFGEGPQRLAANKRLEGMEGSGLASSGRSGPEAQGTLLSPAFTLRNKYVNFLIRGPRDFANVLGAELLVDGQVVRSACATEDRTPPALSWRTWEVADLAGRTARIRVNDHAPWGDLQVDQFEQGDQARGVPCDSTVLFHETHRPQFHYTARAHWLNDPNGLLYYQGVWHLFHQHRGPNDEHIVWAHASSRDLLHWRHMDVALPADDGHNASGSGLVDGVNASGLKQGEESPILLFYTQHPGGGATVENPTPDTPRATQNMAYSTDGGKTFVKFAGNPILRTADCRDRDPKVFWHAPTRSWIMVLSLSRNNAHRDEATYGLYRSADLRNWELLQKIGPGAWYWECPDMFELPVDGDPANRRWLLVKSSGEYIVGQFDGRRFQGETEPIRNRWGTSYYATQTFSDAPGGRRVQIGWMNSGKERRPNSYPGMPFNQQISVPRELALRSTPQGLRVFRNPVVELERLRTKTHDLSGRSLAEIAEALKAIRQDLLDVELEIDLQQATGVRLELRGQVVQYDVRQKRLTACGGYAPLECAEGRLQLRVLLDRTSLEVFAQQGETDLSGVFFIDPAERGLALSVDGGPARVLRLAVHELRSIWEESP